MTGRRLYALRRAYEASDDERLSAAERAVGTLEDDVVARLGAADAGRLRELLERLADG